MSNPKTMFMHQQDARMTETTHDGESRNIRISRLLGYTVRYWHGSDTRDHWDLLDAAGAGVATADMEAEAWQHALDFEHDLNAVKDALLRTDVTLMLHLGVPGTAVIVTEGRANEPSQRFQFSDADVWTQQHRHADIEELAAMALEAWLIAQQ